jgi:hypothetical protein
MTKRSQKLLLAFFLIVLAIIGFGKLVLRALDSVDSGNEELIGTVDPLKADLSGVITRYKMGEVEVVDISAVTTFSWQRLYIFGPYTSLLKIDDTVGRSWRKKCYTDIHVSDGVNLLVFTDGKTVVHCLDYPMNEGVFNFTEPAFRAGISPQEARFTVKNDSLLIWVGNQ